MELVMAILLCLFFLALVIVGQIYLEMDKERSRAIVFIKKMKEPLDEWVRRTDELAGLKSADTLHTLARTYFGCGKQSLKKIQLVNTMAELAEPLAAAVSGPEAGRILKARADAADGLGMLRSGYNQSVRMLNNRLKKKVSAAVGKFFRLSRLEELCDLSRI